jgi:hypothetical protein
MSLPFFYARSESTDHCLALSESGFSEFQNEQNCTMLRKRSFLQ